MGIWRSMNKLLTEVVGEREGGATDQTLAWHISFVGKCTFVDLSMLSGSLAKVRKASESCHVSHAASSSQIKSVLRMVQRSSWSSVSTANVCDP